MVSARALEPLAHGLAIAARPLGLLWGAPLARLLLGATPLHLAKSALTLHLFLQDADCTVDVVVADIDLHLDCSLS